MTNAGCWSVLLTGVFSNEGRLNNLWKQIPVDGTLWTLSPTLGGLINNQIGIFNGPLSGDSFSEYQSPDCQFTWRCVYALHWLSFGQSFVTPAIELALTYESLGFEQHISQNLVAGQNIIELPYMPRILDLPNSNLRFIPSKPLKFTVRAVDALGEAKKNTKLTLTSSAKNVTTKTCKPALSAKSNSQGKATFTLCLTKASTLQVKGDRLVPSRTFAAIKK
jgi:hypothetical protein